VDHGNRVLASMVCGGIEDTAVSEGSMHPHLRAPEAGALTHCLVILPRSFLLRAPPAAGSGLVFGHPSPSGRARCRPSPGGWLSRPQSHQKTRPAHHLLGAMPIHGPSGRRLGVDRTAVHAFRRRSAEPPPALPCGIATATPQTFTVTSQARLVAPPEFPPTQRSAVRTHTSPHPQVRLVRPQEASYAGSSRVPSSRSPGPLSALLGPRLRHGCSHAHHRPQLRLPPASPATTTTRR
jgi:hypothetical protein